MKISQLLETDGPSDLHQKIKLALEQYVEGHTSTEFSEDFRIDQDIYSRDGYSYKFSALSNGPSIKIIIVITALGIEKIEPRPLMTWANKTKNVDPSTPVEGFIILAGSKAAFIKYMYETQERLINQGREATFFEIFSDIWDEGFFHHIDFQVTKTLEDRNPKFKGYLWDN